ncbi:MAG: hypothetical protein SFV23_25225 [Planctomycetaceae bacterium]|nr:hypothetical protein [Planctomycetaceae bacterium]
MNPLSVCLLLIWAAEPMESPSPAVYRFSPQLAAAIRGQSPDPVYDPFAGTGPVLEAPVPAGAYDPYSAFGVPPAQDPFMYGGDPALSLPGAVGPGTIYTGVVGPQPYRFGYIPKMEMGYIPQAESEDAFQSDVEMFEFDSELRHNAPFAPGWIFSTAAQFDYRAWNFGGNPFGNLFGAQAFGNNGRVNLFRFGLDMELIKVKSNGWTFDFDFNPSINTDTEDTLTSDAWNFDTRIAATYQIDQVWTLVLGVQYWDRVDDIVIPHAGVVITPSDIWELRLLFPKARISRFVGHFWGGHHWLYVSSEYNVEAYQFDTKSDFFGRRNRVQYEDWRLALGLRSDHVDFEKFLEVAWVLDRNFEFEKDFPKVDVGDQVLVRGGIRF